jgi:uncharacterized protein YjiS (DUF1127 family)
MAVRGGNRVIAVPHMNFSHTTNEISSFESSLKIADNRLHTEFEAFSNRLKNEDRPMRKYNQTAGFGPLFSAVTAMVSPAHQAITQHSLYDRVEPLKFRPGIRTIARHAMDHLRRWHRRRHERLSLATLDDRLLEDIGVERARAQHESAKPFWQE